MTSSLFKARVAAVVAVASPVIGLAVLIFAGAAVDQCLGGAPRYCDTVLNGGPQSTTGPIGMTTVITACAAVWILSIAYLAARLVGTDRRALLRALGTTLAGAVAAGALAFALAIARGQRLRTGAEDAALYSVGAAAVALTLALVWAAGVRHIGADSSSR